MIECFDPLWLFRARLSGATDAPPPGRRTRRVETPRCVTPRLLVVVTLAEAGGAQTFVAALVAGLRERYAIEVAAHGPGGALVDACAALGVPFHHVRHLRARPAPVARRRGRARAALAGARARARRRADQLLQGRRARAPRARAARAPRRSSPPTAGPSRGAAARPARSTRRPSAPSRRSATRSSASRTTTCSSPASATSSRAAGCT